MPNKAAAAKAWRQTKKHFTYNQGVRAKVEIALRTARKAMNAKTKEAASAVQAAIKTLDRAAQKGVLKANTASRLKSRLMKSLHALKK
jgi:small subunit ribosomal protein S20